jgi:probable phosphoglycerate mutase
MTVIYLIRHGETMWNREKRLQGHIDIGLNEVGHQQADRLAKSMVDKKISAIISSDLSRAIDTAKPIALHHQLELSLDPALRERHYGLMQGLSHQEIADHHPQHHQAWKKRDIHFQPENGESLVQFNDRVVTAIASWAKKYAGQEIAIVAHGGVLDCLNRAARKVALDAPRDFEILNASLNTLTYQDEQFVLVSWGDVNHLTECQGQGQPSKSLDELDGSPK